MTPLVLDASVAVAWIALSQSNPRTETLLRNARQYVFVAPYLFPFEVRSALLKLERRGVLHATETDQGLAGLPLLDIDVELEPALDELDEVTLFARREGVTLFDALYLDQARRMGARLASRDRRQIESALRLRMPVMDLRGPPA